MDAPGPRNGMVNKFYGNSNARRASGFHRLTSDGTPRSFTQWGQNAVRQLPQWHNLYPVLVKVSYVKPPQSSTHSGRKLIQKPQEKNHLRLQNHGWTNTPASWWSRWWLLCRHTENYPHHCRRDNATLSEQSLRRKTTPVPWFETLNPRSTSATLAQLRSGHCILLNLFHIGKTQDDKCSKCGVSPRHITFDTSLRIDKTGLPWQRSPSGQSPLVLPTSYN